MGVDLLEESEMSALAPSRIRIDGFTNDYVYSNASGNRGIDKINRALQNRKEKKERESEAYSGVFIHNT